MKSYADILRELREDRDLTQSQVARILGTTQQVYSRYERGVNEMPVHHLRTLCLYYHTYQLGLCTGSAQREPVAPVKSV